MSQLLPDVDVAQAADHIGDVNDRLAQIQRNFQAANDLLVSQSAVAAGAAAAATRPGMVTMTFAATADTGWLLCDGAAVSRTTFAALFARIGTAAGVGDGATTFNLPNFCGRGPIGAGTGAGGGVAGTGAPTGGVPLTARALGAWLGEETHLLSIAEMPSHNHSSPGYIEQSSIQPIQSGPSFNLDVGTTGSQVPFQGGGGVHNNMEPVLTCNFQIKT